MINQAGPEGDSRAGHVCLASHQATELDKLNILPELSVLFFSLNWLTNWLWCAMARANWSCSPTVINGSPRMQIEQSTSIVQLFVMSLASCPLRSPILSFCKQSNKPSRANSSRSSSILFVWSTENVMQTSRGQRARVKLAPGIRNWLT